MLVAEDSAFVAGKTLGGCGSCYEIQCADTAVGGWFKAQNTFGAAWEASVLPDPPMDIRLTNAKGEQLVLKKIISVPGFVGDVLSDVQFGGSFAPKAPRPSRQTAPIPIPGSGPSPSPLPSPVPSPVPAPVPSLVPSPTLLPTPPAVPSISPPSLKPPAVGVASLPATSGPSPTPSPSTSGPPRRPSASPLPDPSTEGSGASGPLLGRQP
ncbi:unnamed protein product [Ostreobium quekettii]|uniref:Expansin-like EG45 domain-containing protein n=1 Tax=Ostreobium quekettii TaxID=121088 RepID=A0A8S1IM67_9CHLO|nr:unnamed protein product [Ostreobium quekettii]